jgi:phage replication-related protein YjqB (UPF0714/DUF867 family)
VLIPQPPRRATWTELLARPDVVERSIRAGGLGLMAFHGGLEGGTVEIAEAAAEMSGASLYTVVQPAELRWHVPSSSIDPAHDPALAEWLAHVDVAIALHGYGRMGRPRQVLLGGTNRRLASLLESTMRARLTGFEIIGDLALIPPELRGLHPGNPVNRPAAGGVQVELPPSARGTTSRPPDPAWGPGGAPALVVEALVAAAREWDADQPTEGPVARQEVTRQPVTRQPVTRQPVTRRPVTRRPAGGRPTPSSSRPDPG